MSRCRLKGIPRTLGARRRRRHQPCHTQEEARAPREVHRRKQQAERCSSRRIAGQLGQDARGYERRVPPHHPAPPGRRQRHQEQGSRELTGGQGFGMPPHRGRAGEAIAKELAGHGAQAVPRDVAGHNPGVEPYPSSGAEPVGKLGILVDSDIEAVAAGRSGQARGVAPEVDGVDPTRACLRCGTVPVPLPTGTSSPARRHGRRSRDRQPGPSGHPPSRPRSGAVLPHNARRSPGR